MLVTICQMSISFCLYFFVFPISQTRFHIYTFGFIFITIGARTTPSAMVGIIMLSESVLGPIWAFLFVSEIPSLYGLIGGAIILFAVLLQFYTLLKKPKAIVSN